MSERSADQECAGVRLQVQTRPTPQTPRAQSSDDKPKQTNLAFAHINANRMPGLRRVSSLLRSSLIEATTEREARETQLGAAIGIQTSLRRSIGSVHGGS